MKFFYCLLFMGIAYYPVSAQAPVMPKDGGSESGNYRLQRFYISEPLYGLQKIKGLIRGFVPIPSAPKKVDTKIYDLFSLPEKFTYNMIYPESFSQLCSRMLQVEDEQNKLFAYLPDVFGTQAWSKKQRDFFQDNRDSVIKLLKACILSNNRLGLNFKWVIVNINAKSLIPLIISVYNFDKKDHDLLTVLMLLMYENHYSEFLNSRIWKDLYSGADANYKWFIDAGGETGDLVINYATNFYNAQPK